MILNKLYRKYNVYDNKVIEIEKDLKNREVERQEKELIICELEHLKHCREAVNKQINYYKKKLGV
jgi:hypothetical protein|nr:MAG TPA: hypothetical protein [Caudoviricetes sp.]